jgi:hypothetical protein
VVSYEGNEGYVAGALDRNTQRSLVFGADASPAPRLDLGAVRNEPAYLFNVLVIN